MNSRVLLFPDKVNVTKRFRVNLEQQETRYQLVFSNYSIHYLSFLVIF